MYALVHALETGSRIAMGWSSVKSTASPSACTTVKVRYCRCRTWAALMSMMLPRNVNGCANQTNVQTSWTQTANTYSRSRRSYFRFEDLTKPSDQMAISSLKSRAKCVYPALLEHCLVKLMKRFSVRDALFSHGSSVQERL